MSSAYTISRTLATYTLSKLLLLGAFFCNYYSLRREKLVILS